MYADYLSCPDVIRVVLAVIFVYIGLDSTKSRWRSKCQMQLIGDSNPQINKRNQVEMRHGYLNRVQLLFFADS